MAADGPPVCRCAGVHPGGKGDEKIMTLDNGEGVKNIIGG